jgi:osmotically-inducible protein OsmY
LHGWVQGPEERRDIEEVVRRVPAVRDVVNKIRVARTF